MKGFKKLFHKENLLLPIYVYGCVKLNYKNRRKLKHAHNLNLVEKIYLSAISVLITVFVLIFILIFAIFYEIINLILLISHGKNYHGILEGADALWTLEENSKSVINNLVFIETNEHFEQFLKERYGEILKTHFKLSCVRRTFLSYVYLLKINFNADDFIKPMKKYNNLDEFTQILDEYGQRLLPLGHTANFEILIGETRLEFGGKLQFPILFRYHHSVGDGLSIVAMMTTNLIRTGVEIMKQKCQIYKEIIAKSRTEKKKNWNFYIKFCGFLNKFDRNNLHKATLSGRQHYCWLSEEPPTGISYVEKVKRIKNRFEGVNFSDVVTTAFTASLSEYCMSTDKPAPKTIRSCQTLFFASPNFSDLITFKKNGIPTTNLSNKFSMGFMDVPIRDADIKANLIERLKILQRESELLKNSLDYKFIYWQLEVISSIVPLWILKYSVKRNDCTMVVTNVPGNATSKTKSGHAVSDSLIWAPNFLTCGIVFSIFSFDHLFRFGLAVDKTIIKKRSDVQEILNNIFNYIDLLDEISSNLN